MWRGWTIAYLRRKPKFVGYRIRRNKTKFVGHPIHAEKNAIPFLELFKLYRDYLIHQYALLNHRTNWFIGINAFLFATYGFTLQKRLEVMRSPLRMPDDFQSILTSVDNFRMIISLFGAALSFLAYFLLRAAIKPISDLRKLFDDLAKQIGEADNAAEEPQMIAHLPHLVGGLRGKTQGPFLTSCIPALLLTTWIAILFLTIDPHLSQQIYAWVLKALRLAA
jgi:hypothetical protein